MIMLSGPILSGTTQSAAPVTANRLVYAFIGVKADAKLAVENRILENRLILELVKLGVQENFSLTTPKNREDILKEIEFSDPNGRKDESRIVSGNLPSARGIIGGELLKVGEIYSLHLEIIRTETMETINIAESRASTLEGLLEDLKRTVFSLYDLPDPQPLPSPVPPESTAAAKDEISGEDASWIAKQVSMGDIVGTWKGDKGVESVRIKSDGTAVANLGGLNSMRLSIVIDNGRVIVRQDEPNSPKLYLNSFPYSLAVKVAELARPMRWVFSLSRDKKMLQGIKETSFFQIENGRILSTDNSYSRSAAWIRSQ